MQHFAHRARWHTDLLQSGVPEAVSEAVSELALLRSADREEAFAEASHRKWKLDLQCGRFVISSQ